MKRDVIREDEMESAYTPARIAALEVAEAERDVLAGIVREMVADGWGGWSDGCFFDEDEGCAECPTDQLCPVERARRWTAEHEGGQ